MSHLRAQHGTTAGLESVDMLAGAATRVDRSRESGTIERTLALVGDRWTILVLRAAFRGIRRFDDFCADLSIARPILTARLRRLVGAGLMTKELYQAHPPRYEYKLTPSGTALSPAIVALVRWGTSIWPRNRHRPCWSTPLAALNSSRASGAKHAPQLLAPVRFAACRRPRQADWSP